MNFSPQIVNMDPTSTTSSSSSSRGFDESTEDYTLEVRSFLENITEPPEEDAIRIIDVKEVLDNDPNSEKAWREKEARS